MVKNIDYAVFIVQFQEKKVLVELGDGYLCFEEVVKVHRNILFNYSFRIFSLSYGVLPIFWK